MQKNSARDNIHNIVNKNYNDLFQSFCDTDPRVLKCFLFFDKKYANKCGRLQYTFEAMLQPEIVTSDVDLISIEIEISNSSCNISFFANNGEIFLDKSFTYKFTTDLDKCIKYYINKFTKMFDDMLLPYTSN